LVSFSLLLCSTSFAQKVDHLSSYSDFKNEKYFRLNYDNDLFSGTDQNYTQGFNFELVAPFLIDNPINHLFFKQDECSVRYGISLEHNAFTPADFEKPEIQVGDRPFAAAIYLKSFIIAVNPERGGRFTSSISIGIIGPAAFGEEMQTGIHQVTGSQMPMGWQNQIRNDLVLTYQAGYEKKLIRIKDFLSFNAQANLLLGTLFTKALLGLNGGFGILNTPFEIGSSSGKLKLYAFVNPLVNFVGYDATLQGGVFNKSSPYTIAASDTERIIGELNYGIVLQSRSFFLQYSRTTTTREFTTGDIVKWGGLKAGFSF